MAEVVLLDFWASPFCARVKIALGEKGVAYESREEDLFGGKSDLLLKSNPIYQRVPVFLHKGKPLCESSVIVNYIDETWPSPPLLPTCAYERAQARFWTDYTDKKVFEGCANVWKSEGEEEAEVAKKDFIDILKVVESALREKDFFGGDKFGYVDTIMIPLTIYFLASEKIGKFKVETECPKLSNWIKRCLARETVAKVLPDPNKVHEFTLMFRKMLGIE